MDMNANREKTSNMMGLLVSVLLHGIFIAGCYALDASSAIQHSTDDQHITQINAPAQHADATIKPKS